MESGTQKFDRFFKLIASVVTLVTSGKRNVERVCEVLQKIVDEAQASYELYLAPGQQNGGVMTGFGLEKHLRETGRFDRAYSLEDQIVKGWLANPASYPEEFKGKLIFLWKSQRDSGSNRGVACLCWGGRQVVVDWYWLGIRWSWLNPALLASSLPFDL